MYTQLKETYHQLMHLANSQILNSMRILSIKFEKNCKIILLLSSTSCKTLLKMRMDDGDEEEHIYVHCTYVCSIINLKKTQKITSHNI